MNTIDNCAFYELVYGLQINDSVDQSLIGIKAGLEQIFTNNLNEAAAGPESRPTPSKRSNCRGPRIKFTPQQVADLEAVYAVNPNLDFTNRDILADALEVTEGAVNLWFRNRRSKDVRLRQMHNRSTRPYLFHSSDASRRSSETPSHKISRPGEKAGVEGKTTPVCKCCPVPRHVQSNPSTSIYTSAPSYGVRSLFKVSNIGLGSRPITAPNAPSYPSPDPLHSQHLAVSQVTEAASSNCHLGFSLRTQFNPGPLDKRGVLREINLWCAYSGHILVIGAFD